MHFPARSNPFGVSTRAVNVEYFEYTFEKEAVNEPSFSYRYHGRVVRAGRVPAAGHAATGCRDNSQAGCQGCRSRHQERREENRERGKEGKQEGCEYERQGRKEGRAEDRARRRQSSRQDAVVRCGSQLKVKGSVAAVWRLTRRGVRFAVHKRTRTPRVEGKMATKALEYLP